MDGFSKQELAAMFAGDWATKFPPILTVEQTCDLIQLPKGTLYDWSSRGLLDGCAQRAGKHLRIHRDRFIQIWSEGHFGKQ